MNTAGSRNRLIVALDVAELAALASLARQVAPHCGMVKVGLEAFCAHGPAAVGAARDAGAPVFLDLKLHDIPQTTARAATAAARLGVAMLNLHAAAGEEALRRAAGEVRAACGEQAPLLIAVTVLTSLGPAELSGLGFAGDPIDWVRRWSELAQRSGLDGVVASALEAPAIKSACGGDFVVVTPGIRPSWASEAGDQRRVTTPMEALAAGADYLVVGRPITGAADPAAAASRFAAELAVP